MRRLLIVLAILWALPALSPGWTPARAQETMTFEDEPALFVTVEPEAVFSGGAYVQGEIVVTIRMTSLHAFEALSVEVPGIEGAVVETLLKPRTRKVKIYSGTGYVLEQVLAVYPQSSGRMVIPAIRATGRVEPEPDKPLDFTEVSPEIVLDVKPIAASFRGDWWMVSSAVTMTETWSKPVEELREGDVVRREITLTARGVPHTRMKMPEHGRTRGIAFSDAGGTGRTERTTDGVVGTLTRAWDLKIGVGSTLYIAPMGVHYWHPGDQAGRKASVRGYRIEPLPPDEEAIAAALMQEAGEAHRGAWLVALALAALVVLPLLGLLAAWLWALVPTRADRALRAAAAGATPQQLYRAVTAWAAESGISMTDLRHAATPGLGGLLAHLFAGAAGPVEGSRIAGELVRTGRRRRVGCVGESLRRFALAMFGNPARLAENG